MKNTSTKKNNSKSVSELGFLTRTKYYQYYKEIDNHKFLEYIENDLEKLNQISDKVIFLEYIQKETNNVINDLETLTSIDEHQLCLYKGELFSEDTKKIFRDKIIKNNSKILEKIKVLEYRIFELDELINFWNKQLQIDKLDKIVLTNQTDRKKNDYPLLDNKINQTETAVNQESLDINWLTNDSDLYYLIKKMNFQEPKRSLLIDFIKQNFVDKKGRHFSVKPITQGINNLLCNKKSKYKSRHGEEIDTVISESLIEKKINLEQLINNLIDKNYFRESDKSKFDKLTKLIN